MTPVVCEETSVKKRLANVVLTDDRSKVLFDLQRVTGIGAANAAKLAELGATLDGLLDEWKSLIKADPNNGIIMMDKILPIPANATSSEIIRINRERARLLSVKFENTRFIKQLTHHQLVGIKYFDQIEKRIPRAEIQEIERFLKEIASRMSPDFIITICGSYRRGKDSSGDVDVFLTHKEFRTKEDASKFTTKGNKSLGGRWQSFSPYFAGFALGVVACAFARRWLMVGHQSSASVLATGGPAQKPHVHLPLGQPHDLALFH